jgi:metal-responsive CopG/Arc/MetJ family transcriptional regulator
MAKVKISDELFEKVKKYSEIAGYSSVEEFIQHALEKEVSQLDEAGDDEEAVKKKLQGLGYL